MIQNKILFIILCFWSSWVDCQQTDLASLEIELAFHADVMTNASENRHRIQAGKAFNTLMEKAIYAPNSFTYPFDSLKWISKLTPEDKSFRIITWEIQHSSNEVNYFGYIQKPDGTVFPLLDNFKQAESLEEEVACDAWYGAIYYNIMDVKTEKEGTYYLVFGQNKWSTLENKKLIDVIFFSKEGKPYFGKKVFKREEKDAVASLYHRLVFTYASDSRMTINYNPGLEMIVHDNLIPKMSRIEEQSRTYVPDGSYVAWNYDKKMYWVMIDKLATQFMQSAPRPTPVLDARKDQKIFGDQKKKKE